MYTAHGEKLNPYDPHKAHQEQGGKALLASLLEPFMPDIPRYGSIREVLIATAAGAITPEQAKTAIERIQMHNKQRICNK